MMRIRISLEVVVCLGLSLFLFSCGSRRQVRDISLDEDLVRRIETMIEKTIDRKVVEVKTSGLMADVNITERIFDTDRDIDPSTGERPVASRTDTHIVISRRDSTAVADSLGVNKRINNVEDIDRKTDIKIKDVDDKKESKWPIAVIFMSILGMLVIIFLVLKKMGILK